MLPEQSSLASHTAAPLKAVYDVLAPAKLNLFLHITGRRADGYHLLQSVFMLIDWCDTLHFELRKDGVISRTDLGPRTTDMLPAEDLTVRAARALQAATGTSLGVNIKARDMVMETSTSRLFKRQLQHQKFPNKRSYLLVCLPILFQMHVVDISYDRCCERTAHS